MQHNLFALRTWCENTKSILAYTCRLGEKWRVESILQPLYLRVAREYDGHEQHTDILIANFCKDVSRTLRVAGFVTEADLWQINSQKGFEFAAMDDPVRNREMESRLRLRRRRKHQSIYEMIVPRS